MGTARRSAVFSFRLEPVLRARERSEDEQVLALARALMRRAATTERLRGLRQEAAASRQALAQAATGGSKGALLGRLADAIQTLSEEEAAAVSLLNAEDSQVEGARADLVEAARARKVLERLKERQRDSHRRWVEASGRRQADDLVSAHHSWARPGPGPMRIRSA